MDASGRLKAWPAPQSRSGLPKACTLFAGIPAWASVGAARFWGAEAWGEQSGRGRIVHPRLGSGVAAVLQRVLRSRPQEAEACRDLPGTESPII